MKKKLTRQQYKEKFDKQMERFNYIKQPGEIILQCNAPYPDYWFLSNKGYLFTAYYNEARILKPNPTETGKKNKEGKRTGQTWEYEYKVAGEKNNRHVAMHKLMAEMFVNDEFSSDEKREIHHIQKRTSFEANEGHLCNRSENLQILPKSIHKQATYYGRKKQNTLEESVSYTEEIEEALQKFMAIILKRSLESSKTTKKEPYGILKTIEDDPAKIKVDVHTIKGFSFDTEQGKVTINM